MGKMYEGPIAVAPTGSTGNNTHASVQIQAEAESESFEFVVEAVGATPTVTWKLQGSVDQPDVSDANSAWFDILYVTDATDTPAVATIASTTVGKKVVFADELNDIREYRKVRLVTTANTNVTYRCDGFFLLDAD